MYFQLTTTGAVEDSIRTLTRFLKTYQERHPGIVFELRDFDWNDAWPALVRTAIAQTGADVSEIGAPWVSDFVAMDSLRPFTRAEVEAVGGARAFFPAPWANTVISPSSLKPGASPNTPSAPGVYALPGRVDVRMIYFWRDMLEKAGVDPAAAFITPERLEQTLETLRASGAGPACERPWLYHTHATRNWVYNMASWIWAKGGRFTDEAGLPVFDEPEAVEGMAGYFRLLRYLAHVESGESEEQVFSERRAAVMLMATHYHVHLLHNEDPWANPPGARQLLARLGAAPLPGPAFVGGTSFVIWRHADEGAARTGIDLLARLLNSPQMTEYCYETHMLPSRVDGFTHPAVAADPFLPAMRAALETGRTHPTGRLWMPIADGLAAMCLEISKELRQAYSQDEDPDVRALVERRAHALVQRLRRSFAAG